jgi:hypothetical protein
MLKHEVDRGHMIRGVFNGLLLSRGWRSNDMSYFNTNAKKEMS